MTQFLERHNIGVPYFVRKKELEKTVDPQEHCHNTHSKGDGCFDLSEKIKSFSHVSSFDSHSNILELDICFPLLDKSPISSPKPSLNTNSFPLAYDFPTSNYFRIH